MTSVSTSQYTASNQNPKKHSFHAEGVVDRHAETTEHPGVCRTIENETWIEGEAWKRSEAGDAGRPSNGSPGRKEFFESSHQLL